MQKHSKRENAPFFRPFGASEKDVQKLHALHLGYNTNFQQFSWDGHYLSRRDGENHIMVRFR